MKVTIYNKEKYCEKGIFEKIEVDTNVDDGGTNELIADDNYIIDISSLDFDVQLTAYLEDIIEDWTIACYDIETAEELLQEHDQAVIAYACEMVHIENVDTLKEEFENFYINTYDSERDYVESIVSDLITDDIPKIFIDHFDIDSLLHDIKCEAMHTFIRDVKNSCVYVFSN